MSGWVLILTATWGSNAMAIAQVGPFASQELCLSAAKLWVEQLDHVRVKSAICAQTTVKGSP